MRLAKAWLTVLFTLSLALSAAGQDKPPPAGAAADKKAEEKKAADAKATEKKPGDAAAADKQGEPAPAAATQPEGPSTTPDTGAGSTPAGTSATPAAAPGGSVDGATYAVRLRDLEQRIDELKEQIRRSHTRLSLLSDTILSGGVGGARAEIRFTNDMSTAFKLNRALFVLDGAVQYNKQDDTGALAEQKQIPIFSGSIPPGDHTLQVMLQLRGHGYGVFSYLRGYKFEVKSSHSFTVTEGKSIELEAIAWEKGGVTTPLEQRPAVRYVEKIRSGFGESPAAASQPAAPSKSGASGSFSIGTGGK